MKYEIEKRVMIIVKSRNSLTYDMSMTGPNREDRRVKELMDWAKFNMPVTVGKEMRRALEIQEKFPSQVVIVSDNMAPELRKTNVLQMYGSIDDLNSIEYEQVLRREDEFRSLVDTVHLLMVLGDNQSMLSNINLSVFPEFVLHTYSDYVLPYASEGEILFTYDPDLDILMDKLGARLSKKFMLESEEPYTPKVSAGIDKNIEKYADFCIEYDSKVSLAMKQIYPFLTRYNGVFVDAMWHAFCRDIDSPLEQVRSLSLSVMDNPFFDLRFFDFFLVYNYFSWSGEYKTGGVNKFCLTEGANNEDENEIGLYKNELMKRATAEDYWSRGEYQRRLAKRKVKANANNNEE